MCRLLKYSRSPLRTISEKAEGKQSFVISSCHPTLNCIRYPKRSLVFSSLQQQPSFLALAPSPYLWDDNIHTLHLVTWLHHYTIAVFLVYLVIVASTQLVHTLRSTTLHITISPSGICSLRPLESSRNLPNPSSTQQNSITPISENAINNDAGPPSCSDLPLATNNPVPIPSQPLPFLAALTS